MLLQKHVIFTFTQYLTVHVSLLVGVFILTLWLLCIRFRKGLREIPGPILASLSPLDRLWTAARGTQHQKHIEYHRQYGPFVRVGPNHVSVSDAQYIPQIYGIGSKYYKSDFYLVFDVQSSQGKLPSVFSIRDAAAHSTMKRHVASAYAMSSLLELEPLVDECTLILKSKLEGMQGRSFDLGKWLHWYAFDVISAISFSSRFEFMQEETDVAGVIKAIEGRLVYNTVIGQIPSMHKFLFGNALVSRIASFIPKIKKLNSARYLAHFTEKQVQRYQSPEAEKHEYRDLLARFKRIKDEEVVMTDAEFLVHASGNIFAGSDTTAISLRSLFYYLSRSPRCLKKAVDEIISADARGQLSALVTFAEAQNLTYFQACMKEALRMHPAVGLLLERIVPPEGADFGDIHLPGGTIVGMNPWVMGYDKTVYGDDADMYRPERWLEADSETLKSLERSLFAFGSGARTCLGKNISLMEMSKLVPQLLRNFEFEVDDVNSDWVVQDYWFVKQTNLRFRVKERIKK